MPKHFTKTPGFKLFGTDWQPVYELCLEQMEYAYYENQLIRKILHIGHKLSKPGVSEEKEFYTLILLDLQKRVAEETERKESVERLIAEAFDELVERKKIKINLC